MDSKGQAKPDWKLDYAFWEIYCRKTKNWGVGPMATRTNDPKIEKEWFESSAKIYKMYKGKEDTIPGRYPRCPN